MEAIYIEVCNTLWCVTYREGENWLKEAESAAIMAAATGSTGSTSTRTKPDSDEVDASATVTRARNVYTDPYGKVVEPDPDEKCASCERWIGFPPGDHCNNKYIHPLQPEISHA